MGWITIWASYAKAFFFFLHFFKCRSSVAPTIRKLYTHTLPIHPPKFSWHISTFSFPVHISSFQKQKENPLVTLVAFTNIISKDFFLCWNSTIRAAEETLKDEGEPDEEILLLSKLAKIRYSSYLGVPLSILKKSNPRHWGNSATWLLKSFNSTIPIFSLEKLR